MLIYSSSGPWVSIFFMIRRPLCEDEGRGLIARDVCQILLSCNKCASRCYRGRFSKHTCRVKISYNRLSTRLILYKTETDYTESVLRNSLLQGGRGGNEESARRPGRGEGGIGGFYSGKSTLGERYKQLGEKI
jgi:hypothetical protein